MPYGNMDVATMTFDPIAINKHGAPGKLSADSDFFILYSARK